MAFLEEINNAITIAKRLRDVNRDAAAAEFKAELTELISALADAKLEAAELKANLAELKEENRVLRLTAAEPDEKPTGSKWGCYVFEGDNGLFCKGCWDDKRKKISTNRLDMRFRQCPVCKAKISARG